MSRLSMMRCEKSSHDKAQPCRRASTEQLRMSTPRAAKQPTSVVNRRRPTCPSLISPFRPLLICCQGCASCNLRDLASAGWLAHHDVCFFLFTPCTPRLGLKPFVHHVRTRYSPCPHSFLHGGKLLLRLSVHGRGLLVPPRCSLGERNKNQS